MGSRGPQYRLQSQRTNKQYSVGFRGGGAFPPPNPPAYAANWTLTITPDFKKANLVLVNSSDWLVGEGISCPSYEGIRFGVVEVKIHSFFTHCGRVTQICVFNTGKPGTSASSP